MPSLGSHMVRARRLAAILGLPEIDADRGAFYLGSTAPDIRVITRGERADTHFFDLDDLERQDSVERMLEAHPELRKPAGLDAATTAFIAGFITHLVLDEAWVEEIYRPTFGVYSEIDADPRSNVWDRVLQYELDRLDRLDDQTRVDLQGALAESAPPPGVPFIEDENLTLWFEMINEVAGLEPDYSRFRPMMMRHLEGAGFSEHDIDACCEDPSDIVKEALGVVSQERVDRFWAHAEEIMQERVRRYLR